MAKRKVSKVQFSGETYTEYCSFYTCSGYQAPVELNGNGEKLTNRLINAFSKDGYDEYFCTVCDDTALSSGEYFHTLAEVEAYANRYKD